MSNTNLSETIKSPKKIIKNIVNNAIAEVITRNVLNDADFETKHPRNKDGTFAKIKQLADDLKVGKYNPKRFKGEVITTDNIDSAEKDYVISEITSNMTKAEIQNGFAVRQLFNEKDKKYYFYDLIYDKDGMHKITKRTITDEEIKD